MTMNLRLPTTLLAFLGLAFASGEAPAGGVVVCNNCTSVAQAAKQGGNGLVIVSDFSRKKIWGFRNEYDRETGGFLPMPVPIPGAINHSHQLTMSAVTPASADIVLRQDDPGSNAFPFPAGFEGWSAYEVATDTNMRAQFGRALAASYAGATTSSNTWNNLATSLKSLAVDWMSGRLNFDFITITVHWSDGSITPMVIRKGNVTLAEPIQGQSFDADGNRIPDPEVTQDGSDYVGNYRFRSDANLDNWLYAANRYGVPITGTPSRRMSCSWDGQTLRCHYY
ncbi:hypothetical protein [Marilutibacter spongiae]|uniref:Uncharacterized protein n=1 Tax=Marilutibacter spongiae TaxID=2025720 RepID=A0A7W3TNI8_9GAMM|nr:hypothetical protein [Lysobacter spongiae]MBB1061616.1 hypothetical protein [Lysobacter spongiae]